MRWFVLVVLLTGPFAAADDWKSDPIWHDGLSEKATYAAVRPFYGKDRPYEAIFFTNKEQHDRNTLTKAEQSGETVQVFKHNHIEVVPTPNYDYKFVTTSHLAVDDLSLTRLDCSSQEFCGTSFKQFLNAGEHRYEYWSFSYMPEAGRRTGIFSLPNAKVVAEDSMPLWLRDLDFATREPVRFKMFPTQKSNLVSKFIPVAAEARCLGEDGDAYKVEVYVFAAMKGSGNEYDQPAALLGTFWMAKDRLHVMTRAKMQEGQTYELKTVERVNYWVIKGE